MASPSPSVLPPEDSLNSTTISPPSPSPPSESLIISPSPTSTIPSKNADPPSTPSTPSVPTPSPPPAVPAAPPPSPPPLLSSPPAPPASPPLSPPDVLPPLPLLSPPPLPPLTSPPPPSPLDTPPPPSSASPPPPPSIVSPPPPSVNSPPPPDSSPPPPVGDSPPPQSDPTPPASTSPPPPPPLQTISPSPPPPTNVPTPPSPKSPPPPAGHSPKTSPPSPKLSPPPPPHSQSPPPFVATPPGSTLPSPPPSVHSPPAPAPISVHAPPTNSSGGSPTTPPMSSATPPMPSATPEQPIQTNNGTDIKVNDSTRDRRSSSTGTTVAVASVIGVLVLSLVIVAVWFVQKRKRRKKNTLYALPSPFSSQNSDSFFLRPHSSLPLVGSRADTEFKYASSEGGGVGNSRWFSYEELAQATSGFSSINLLGEGGFGCVYKGTLADGREVAVKQLKVGGGQGEREFRAEVEIISRVHHRHLVSLVGYCISDHQRLLVYDYVPNDTLHYHLHSENNPVLAWATRVQIAAGAARGIAYLHEDCHPRIIHRDIKSSNILLDINFEAQVADFGLAKLSLDSHTHVTTRVMGTFGYMAPEYATSGKLTDKSDVYSYGVVLLELITGRKPVDSSQPLGDESLVEWARPLLSQAIEDENFEELVDPRLDRNYVDREMFRMIEAAAACIRHSAVKRPKMSQVVRALDSLDEMSDLANGVKPGQSGVFNSAEHSAQIRMFQRMAFGSQEYNSSENFDRSRSQSSWRSRESRDPSPTAPINRSRLWNN